MVTLFKAPKPKKKEQEGGWYGQAVRGGAAE